MIFLNFLKTEILQKKITTLNIRSLNNSAPSVTSHFKRYCVVCYNLRYNNKLMSSRPKTNSVEFKVPVNSAFKSGTFTGKIELASKQLFKITTSTTLIF